MAPNSGPPVAGVNNNNISLKLKRPSAGFDQRGMKLNASVAKNPVK
jgi:hypothetical protein